MASNASRVAAWAADELDAWVTLENPETSYVWPFATKCFYYFGKFQDIAFSTCMYDSPLRRHTKSAVLELDAT